MQKLAEMMVEKGWSVKISASVLYKPITQTIICIIHKKAADLAASVQTHVQATKASEMPAWTSCLNKKQQQQDKLNMYQSTNLKLLAVFLGSVRHGRCYALFQPQWVSIYQKEKR